VITENSDKTSTEIQKVKLRLQALEEEKSQLFPRKAELESGTPELVIRSTPLTAKEKIALLQGLYIGRDDIFALRWENNAGKYGYAGSISQV